ncbi:hypothetical protein B0T19DRAFT_101016 [Cercophora scortea]|uniref:Secreted protein n=1 Tax=Cercophora scortea TaxID=314031 RepID=A0AAE0IW69_9PEZI|nr:hypothetical protein B0T19DRAFT_101016 [Cercophora scortea]
MDAIPTGGAFVSFSLFFPALCLDLCVELLSCFSTTAASTSSRPMPNFPHHGTQLVVSLAVSEASRYKQCQPLIKTFNNPHQIAGAHSLST